MKMLASLLSVVFLLTTASSISAHKTSMTFTISNQQSADAGMVTVNTPDNGYSVSAPGNSNVAVEIDYTAISVTINGYTVPQGARQVVILASGKALDVMWTSTNSIVIVDQGQIK